MITRKMDVHEFKLKECVKWSRSGILSAKPARTMVAFMQYDPFVYSAHVMATRLEIVLVTLYPLQLMSSVVSCTAVAILAAVDGR